jgi:hypothetical protein
VGRLFTCRHLVAAVLVVDHPVIRVVVRTLPLVLARGGMRAMKMKRD